MEPEETNGFRGFASASTSRISLLTSGLDHVYRSLFAWYQLTTTLMKWLLELGVAISGKEETPNIEG
jgi:hypothetical protein